MEFELKLHNLNDTLGLLDTLNNNKYVYLHGTSYDVVRNDMINIFNNDRSPKGFYVMYWIVINPEIKKYSIHSKYVDISYLRSEKLKQMNLWL